MLPQTLAYVGEGAFSGCTGLEQVLVPQSVTAIGETAFDGCASTTFVCERGTKAAEFAEAKGIPTTETVPLALAVADCEREVAYRPGAVEPEIAVSVGESKLVAGRDYNVSYANNVGLGRAMATVTAVEGGGYSGVQYCAFSIVPADVSSADVEGVAARIYNGEAQAQSPIVRVGGNTLSEGVDYELSYESNVNAGTATMTVVGRGNYAGSKSVAFKVNAVSLKDTEVTGVSARTYSGAAQAQSPVVKLGGCTLRAGTDYVLSYKNNVNAGTATVTMTGKGNYAGSKSVAFKISPASVSGAAVTGVSARTYNGKAQTQSPTVKVGGRTLANGKDYELSYKDNVNPGTATMIVTGRGNYAGSKAVAFQIKHAPGWAKESGRWYYYDGSGKKATGWLKDGGRWYYLDGSGAMTTGWQKVSGKWYLMDGSGAMTTGWQRSGGKWYYMGSDGAMRTGWQKVSGKWYLLASGGAMLTGWQKSGGKWYLLASGGAMLTGWQKSGGKWYYMDSSGAMVTGWQKIGGKWYQFSSSGAWVA